MGLFGVRRCGGGSGVKVEDQHFVRTIGYYLLVICCVVVAYVAGIASYPIVYPLAQPFFGFLGTPMLNAPVPDPEDMTVFWEAWHLLDRDFYGTKPDGSARRYGAIHGLVNAFADPYTRYEEPVQSIISGEQFCGCFGGIGATIEQVESTFLLHPLPEQPAAVAGVLDGDRLLQVDETVITAEMTIDDVVRLVRGEVGSEVKVVVQRPALATTTAVNVANASGAPATPASQLETLSFVIERVELQTPSMEWRLLDDDPATAMIGYVRHSQFTANSPEEMRRALAELQERGAKGYLLDLRGNPGGPVDAALQMADMWLEEGLLLIEEHANGEREEFRAEAGTAVGDAPLLVIVDAGSASASEILAGALQDHGRAQLVGEQTYGKGSVQLRYELADSSSLYVTNAQWFTPDHHKIAGTGLTPDIPVEAGTDPLPVAVTTLLQLLANQ